MDLIQMLRALLLHIIHHQDTNLKTDVEIKSHIILKY